MNSIQRIGAFFDGTGNHKDNDKAINDGSLTNIGKLHDAYGGKAFYVEGVGTRHLSNAEVELIKQGIADKNDYYNRSAMAFGTEVKAKVNEMLYQVKSYIANNPDSEVVIDVFGFSRGSTEARDFINEINTLYGDNPNVKIGVAGLYDTVATVGLSNEYNDGLNLDLNGNSAEKVIHLTAKDESRFNFSLESLKDESGNLPSNFMELEIAGAHADIGGGYKFTEKEYYKEESGFVQYTNELDKEYQINKIQQEALENGFEIQNINEVSNGMLSYDIMSSREVSYGLSNVSLKLMSDLLIQSGVPIDVSRLSDSLIPNDLNDYYNNLLHGDATSLSSELINKYVHNSDTGERTADSLSDVLANFEEPSGQRDIYTNNLNNAVSVFNREVSYSSEDNTFYYKNEKGNWGQITYNENNDLLIYGNPSNPDKIIFTDENGEYQEWVKDNEGNYVQSDIGQHPGYDSTTQTVLNQIGSLIISTNQNFSNIEKIAVSTTVSTIADLASYKGEVTSEVAQNEAVDNLKGAVVSFAVSAYFAKNDNISDLLGMDGTFLGDFADFAVTYTIASAATLALKEGIDAVVKAYDNVMALNDAAVNGISSLGGGYLGSLAANELMGWDTKEEMIGSSIGSAVATVSLTSTLAPLIAAGPVGWFIGAFMAAFGGSVLGGLIGGLFGGTPPPPEAQALFEFDEETGTYTLIASSSDNGGNEEALKNIGENFGKQLVNMFMIPGGQLTDANGMPDIYLNQVDQLVKLNEQNGSFDTVSDMMAKALSIQIPFINVEDGDPYILRAIHRTNDGFYEEGVNNDDNNASLEELYDNIELAQDYSKYMNEVMVIVDEDGRPIVDNELLQQINEEYQAISAIVDEAERNALMEAFTTKYIFTTYTQFVDTLLEEISDDDIQAYLDERATIEEDFNTQINSATQKLQAVENSLESIEQQLETLIEQYNYTSDKKAKEALETQINTLSEKESLLIQDKQTLTQEIPLLKQQKEETLTAFDDEHFKEIEAIHWNEVFEMAIELSLDEHHYSEDFNKINTQIAQYNYDEHEKNENPLLRTIFNPTSALPQKNCSSFTLVNSNSVFFQSLELEQNLVCNNGFYEKYYIS